MDKNDLRDLAVEESRNKYGSWDDDIDTLAAALDGHKPVNRGDSVFVSSDATPKPVDESFWRATRSESKYGR